MAREYSVRWLDEVDYDAWNSLVASAPSGSVYTSTGYLDALCSAVGGQFRVLGVRHGEEMVGGIALYERTSAAGSFVSPRLLLYYNGPVVREYGSSYPSENSARELAVLAAIERGVSGAGYDSVNLRARRILDVRPFLVRGWNAAPSYSYVVQLAAPGCWSRIEQNLRRLVERARASGLEFCEDEDFDAFFSLHAATLARHDVGVYLPRENFRRYFEGLRSRALASLFHVRAQDGRVAASLLVLLGGNNVSHSVSAASDPGFNRAGASVLLRWNVFRALAERGYAANDLTDASLDSVGHFKAQLGGALEMSLVLQSPRSARFRAVESLSSRAAHARAAAGRIVRGILPRQAQ